MRQFVIYLFLLLLKAVSRLLFRFRTGWIGEPLEGEEWERVRLCAILNHTSLYEPIFAAVVPNRFLRHIAFDGVVPIADKTMKRPITGTFFRMVANNVVSITRQRDRTWETVLERIGAKSMVVILPEGRMKRPNGLDSEGKPMTVRGGIADLLRSIDGGPLLLAYSGGLHHIQAPGERFPRPFRVARLNFEVVDIDTYRDELLAAVGEERFRKAVIEDLERRRDAFCPTADNPGARLVADRDDGADDTEPTAVPHRPEESTDG